MEMVYTTKEITLNSKVRFLSLSTLRISALPKTLKPNCFNPKDV